MRVPGAKHGVRIQPAEVGHRGAEEDRWGDSGGSGRAGEDAVGARWRTTTLGACCEIVSGATPSTGETRYWDGEIAWATPKDLSRLDGKFVPATERRITRAGLESCTASVLPPGSVLFSSRAPIGHVAINTVPMATNQGFKSFIPNSNEVDPHFLYHWLCARRSYLESLGNGATFKEISKAVVSRVEIVLPRLPEQRRIADILDKADAIRRKRKQAIALTEVLLRSAFLEMFGDPVTNPKGWEVRGLCAVCSPKQWPTLAASQLSGSGYPVFGANGVIGYHSHMNHAEPTVLITCRGATCGTINVCMPNSYVTGNSMALDDPDRSMVTPGYLEWVLRLRGLADSITGSAQPQITRQSLQKVKIPLPPVDSQYAFAELLEKNVVLRTKCEHASASSQMLFDSLVARAFSGSLEASSC